MMANFLGLFAQLSCEAGFAISSVPFPSWDGGLASWILYSYSPLRESACTITWLAQELSLWSKRWGYL